MSAPVSGWYADPTGRHELRGWDGARWIDHVVDDGVISRDPIARTSGASTAQDAADSATLRSASTEHHQPSITEAQQQPKVDVFVSPPMPVAGPVSQPERMPTGPLARGEAWAGSTIRENNDVGDDAIYPIVGAEPNTIAVTSLDGLAPLVVGADGLELVRYDRRKDKWVDEASISSVRISVYLTDCRVAWVCSRYDKGGGWVGGVGAMVVLNAASMIRAALRSRGTALVGQVRYPWLSTIAASPRAGWGGSEQIHFTCQDHATGDMIRVGLLFPKQTAALDLANQIAYRCARYRLAKEPDAKPEALAAWRRATTEAVLQTPEKGKLARFSFESASKVHAATAYGSAI